MSCDIQSAADATSAGPRVVLTPRADIHETAEHIVLLTDLPGVPLAAVNISLEQNLLTISGSQSAANDDAGYELSYAEFEPGAFHRTFRIDTAVERDKIKASMQYGVLRLTLPKAAPARVTKIEVAGA